MLTYDHVRRLIAEEEIPLRCQGQETATAVEAISRYGAIVGCDIEHHARLNRGMDRARQLIGEAEEKDRSLASGTVVVADELTGGKGRFQRTWHAPTGGIWLTLVLADTLLPETSKLYPLAAGIACCELMQHYRVPAHIKWVNDIQVEDRKIAGILTETFQSPKFKESYVLIGIGINVNNDVFPPELLQSATAMKTVLGTELDTGSATARLLAKLAWNIGLLHYEEQQRLKLTGSAEEVDDGKRVLTSTGAANRSNLLLKWLGLCDMVGRRVLFGYDIQKNPLYEATALGLNAKGGLVLSLADGTTVVEYGGEFRYLD